MNPDPKPPKKPIQAVYPFKRNKFNAVRQTYNGKSYDSKLEASWAAYLDLLMKAKVVKDWQPQYTFKIEVNGILIARYSIDFKVEFVDGRIEYWEVKGGKATQTQLWRLKWKLCQALYPDFVFKLKTTKPPRT